ncbi:AGAP009306-PA, partial [Anopheles gambiae str. PEST]
LILEINSEVALFRDLLIHVGQSRDCPELREKIRKLRRSCVEACKHTAALILPQIRTAIAEGILTDNPHLVLLFYLAQLFLRELIKSHRLVQVIPMDMSGYYGKFNRAGPSNLGNVISQILLCKQITPDFNQEELCSITKDSQEIARILQELQEFMPQQE